MLAEYRITHYDPKRGTVRFAFRDYAEGGKTLFKTLPVVAFLGRLIRYIPDKHFKTLRYAGIFATRWRDHYLAHAVPLSSKQSPANPRARRSLCSPGASAAWPKARTPCCARAVYPWTSSGSSSDPTSPSPSCFARLADLWRPATRSGRPDKPLRPALRQVHLLVHHL